MNPTSLFIILAIISSGLVSCSSIKTTMQKVGNPMKSLASANVQRLKDFRIPGMSRSNPNTPPIVKIRRKDLREVQFGKEKVLAWTRSQKQGGGVFYFPSDFDPADLPIGGQLPATGILPPLNFNEGSLSDDLPADIANLPDLTSADFESAAPEKSE